MIILEISLNGEVVYRVGGDDLTRIGVLLDARGRLGDHSAAQEPVTADFAGSGVRSFTATLVECDGKNGR